MRRLSPTGRAVVDEGLTYLRPERIRAIEWCTEQVKECGVPGDFVECGVALGGSAVLLATRMGTGRMFHGYDVFGMIPAPGRNDPPEAHARYETIHSGRATGIDGSTYYGYRSDLREHVERTLLRYGVSGDRFRLHEGLFEETLHLGGPVALAHVDADWFEPVDTCLRRIGPGLSPGGFLLLDDYYDYGGCRRAVDKFVSEFVECFRVQRFSTNIGLVRTGVPLVPRP